MWDVTLGQVYSMVTTKNQELVAAVLFGTPTVIPFSGVLTEPQCSSNMHTLEDES